MKINFHHG
jgi:hypothetical protein